VFDPKVEPTNWQAEQAMRQAVINRKVWGGNRTRAGANTRQVFRSVFETYRRHARAIVDPKAPLCY
jgi:transposase